VVALILPRNGVLADLAESGNEQSTTTRPADRRHQRSWDGWVLLARVNGGRADSRTAPIPIVLISDCAILTRRAAACQRRRCSPTSRGTPTRLARGRKVLHGCIRATGSGGDG
jgi:hypothetical protein